MFLSLLQLINFSKLVRIGVAFGLLLPALSWMYSWVVQVFSNFIMPYQFSLIWNFFEMSKNVSIILGAYSAVIITKLIISFSKSLMS